MPRRWNNIESSSCIHIENLNDFSFYKNRPFLRLCSPSQNKNEEYQLKRKLIFHKLTAKQQNKPFCILLNECLCLVQILSNLDCVAKIKAAVCAKKRSPFSASERIVKSFPLIRAQPSCTCRKAS